jgi:hypothetical protein
MAFELVHRHPRISYSVLQSLDDLGSIGDAYTDNMTPSNDANVKNSLEACTSLRGQCSGVYICKKWNNFAQNYEHCSTQGDTIT